MTTLLARPRPSGTRVRSCFTVASASVVGQPLLAEPDWLRRALAEHGALGFRSVPFASPEGFLAFAKSFGSPIEVGLPSSAAAVQLYISEGRAPQSRSCAPPPARGSDFWHSDNSYNLEPAACTLLYLLEGANETETMLCDAQHAYETLDAELRHYLESEALLAEHDSAHNAGQRDGAAGAAGSARRAPVRSIHPLLRAHPLTGRVSLFANPLYTTRLLQPPAGPGDRPTPLPPAESASLLHRLFEHMLSADAGGTGAFAWRAPGGTCTSGASPWRQKLCTCAVA